ncbi:MAG TPA: GxxExxY protein [Vicingus sp.]|nr:GxxExxY protein [Flavobacteriales bacterium]MCL4856013.1 GxxExxY protein [Flavobacteriales bacterium]HRN42323.1 GxxExxY protein [Vicingus sp.]HRP59041.1 GxxExxY protein [Vicingus sp.]
MNDLLYKEEVYDLVGMCMEIHRILGKGFSEIVYKDALEYECKSRNYQFNREKEFQIQYKDIILKHNFYADFVMFDKIILEIKSCESICDAHIGQTLNYLAASKLRVGLIINFGKDSLEYRRIVL